MSMSTAATSESNIRSRQFRSIGVPSLLSAIVLWASFPPLGLSGLAWLAPLGWLAVIDRISPPTRLGYFFIWLSGAAFWLLALQGIRLAFFPLTFGWIALSLYLAVYIPLFVGISRVLLFRGRVPLIIAAPIAWVGMELIRGYVITGFSACLLAHTQVEFPMVLQIADMFGGYGVSFVIMMVSVGLYQLAMWERLLGRLLVKQLSAPRPVNSRQIFCAGIVLLATLFYGWWRLGESDKLARLAQPLLRVALIQENAPSIFDNPSVERDVDFWNNYLAATREAGRAHTDLDLVIWPESVFSLDHQSWLEIDVGDPLPDRLSKRGFSSADLHELKRRAQQQFHYKAARVLSACHGTELLSPEQVSKLARPHLLLGGSIGVIGSATDSQRNTALFVGPDTHILDRYEKVHLVMFGEYIPWRPLLGFLGDLFGFVSTDAGNEPKSFEVSGVRLAPSICFESVLPHFLSWQLRVLRGQAKSPDILVNITNDSWFRGSSILDHHLACSVLATIEHRRPILIAANCGLSAWIDGAGRLQAVSPRLVHHVILATPHRDSRWGLYQWLGDTPAWLCAVISIAAIVATRFGRKS